MADRFISVDKFNSYLKKHIDEHNNCLNQEYKELTDGYYDGICACRAALLEFETADVQPVKHGKWEKLTIVPATDTGNCILARCSKCGDTVFYTVTGREITLKYCPNCGARMIKDGDTDA